MSNKTSDIFDYQITSLNRSNDSRKKEIKTIKKDIYSILQLISKSSKETRILRNEIVDLNRNIGNKDTSYIKTKLTNLEKQADISSSDFEDCSDLEDSINEYIRLQIKYQLDIELNNINAKFEQVEKDMQRFNRRVVDTSSWHNQHKNC